MSVANLILASKEKVSKRSSPIVSGEDFLLH